MADLIVKTVDDEQKFVYEKTIDAAGLRSFCLEAMKRVKKMKSYLTAILNVHEVVRMNV